MHRFTTVGAVLLETRDWLVFRKLTRSAVRETRACTWVSVCILLLVCTIPARAWAGVVWQQGDVITFPQEMWGDTPNPGTPAQMLVNNFSAVYAPFFGILEVGIPGAAGRSMRFTGGSAVVAYLPASGPPAALTADLINPTSSSSGHFGGDVVALKVNVDFSDAGLTLGDSGIPFGDLTLCNFDTLPLLNGLTVREFMQEPNTALGGGSAIYDIFTLDGVTGSLNGSFLAGFPSSFAQDHLVYGPCSLACQTDADCADADGDGVRDDNCVWQACVFGACQAADIVFADMGGAFGACAPDGTADANDRFHALNCFSDVSTTGAVGYPCEDSPPAAYNVDAGGPFGDCGPDGVCDGNDAFHALNAFAGSTACSCPAESAPPACVAEPSHSCTSEGPAGCDVLGCCAAVCEANPFCCENSWDSFCVSAAELTCLAFPWGVCGDPLLPDCDQEHSGTHCNDFACCVAVCNFDNFCCAPGGSWNSACVSAAADLCAGPGPQFEGQASPKAEPGRSQAERLRSQPEPLALEAKPESESAALTLLASRQAAGPGELVSVEVFFEEGLADVRGYQLHIGVGGGDSGTFELVDMAIEPRADHAFAGLPYWQAFNVRTRQMVAGLDSSGVATPARAYLATFTFQASDEAGGRFTIDLLHDDADPAQRTFLFPTPAGAKIAIDSVTPTAVTVEPRRSRAGR